jgi:DNA helicase-2/ATP-dependent DNA helicase PcrA
MEDPDKLEEERRLFYVGITRAERKLYLSFAESRRRNGQVMSAIRSRFLNDVPASMLEERKTIKLRSAGRGAFSQSSAQRESGFGQTAWRTGLSRAVHDVPVWKGNSVRDADVAEPGGGYVTGERIRHKLFGGGKITELSGSGRDVKAVIEFDDANVGRKTIKLAYTTLEKGQG